LSGCDLHAHLVERGPLPVGEAVDPDTGLVRDGVRLGLDGSVDEVDKRVRDEIHGLDWLQGTLQNAVFTRLATVVNKIPLTDKGAALLPIIEEMRGFGHAHRKRGW